MTDPAVLAKQAAAIEWCKEASEFSAKHGAKPWQYALIPHDMVAENMTLKGLVGRFGD
jgi:type III restriction enzyme